MQKEKHFDRLLIAAYRLPYKFTKVKNEYKAVQNSGGLVSAILSLSESFKKGNTNYHKIVWAGIADKLPDNYSSAKNEKYQFDIAPVQISKELNDLFYGGFCNDLIWPLFHYFPAYSVFNNNYFQAYIDANLKFCDEIVKVYKPGDYIWIHDYQLMLLPKMIRERIPNATIGFFLHIPFPSFEIFRLLPRKWREEILLGMLGADLVGFHTHDYTQYFIKSVKRTVGLECRQNLIYTANRLVKADAFPIGIDFTKFHNACQSRKVTIEKNKIRKNLLYQKFIFSVDRLDYTKGLLHRLKGFETFLEKYPKWHSKVVFNMVIIPSRDNIEKYKSIKSELESTIGRINGNYSSLAWRPIIYQYKSLNFNELVALYDLSDIGLITPLRDGMNLVAKEYVACQVENEGVLILSEMAGAAMELKEALIINPADSVEMADAIFNALEMNPAEKHLRIKSMQARIENYNVLTWAFDFIQQTFFTQKQLNLLNVKFVDEVITNQIVAAYKKASKRILFLDYDGTLVAFEKFPELATIDFQTLTLIKNLVKDPKNKLVIISGRNKEFIDKQFKTVTPITLIAEHGCFIRSDGENWESVAEIDLNYRDVFIPILNEYVKRCNGSFIEDKDGSIAWHYRNADQDFAQLRLEELREDLEPIVRQHSNFELLEGSKVLEIKFTKCNKGEAAAQIMGYKKFDFILAAGDDFTDESLFKALPQDSNTLRVGIGPSLARYNLSNNSFLLNLLKKLLE